MYPSNAWWAALCARYYTSTREMSKRDMQYLYVGGGCCCCLVAQWCPCPSTSPGACSNPCPLCWWYHTTISSSVVPLSSCLLSFTTSGSFPMSQFFTSGGQSIRASVSISPSSEYSGLISFRMDWLDLLAVQNTLKSLLQHHSSKVSILRCSAFFMVQLLHPYILEKP